MFVFVFVCVCEYFIIFEIPLLYDIWISVIEHHILSYFHSIPVDIFILLYICHNFIMYFLIALSTLGKEREELMAPAALRKIDTSGNPSILILPSFY